MSFDPLSAVVDLGKAAIKSLFVDKTEQLLQLGRLEELRHAGNLAELQAHVSLLTGQLEVNAQEAKHPSIFVAGWRPGVGWVCSAALAYNYIIYPFMLWGWAISGTELAPPPPVEVGTLYPLLMGMLGIGTMRSMDKKNGVDTKKTGNN